MNTVCRHDSTLTIARHKRHRSYCRHADGRDRRHGRRSGPRGGRRPPGSFLPPVLPLRVTAAFDPPAHDWGIRSPWRRPRGVRGYGGGAAAAGTVTFAGTVVDRGVVVISHGAVRTTYEPVVPSVAVGAAVTARQVIGVIGTGAHCSARCLHWGAKLGDDYIDPLALLRDYRPVLKTPRS